MMDNIILAMTGLDTLRALDMYIVFFLINLNFETECRHANAKAQEAVDHLASFQSS